MLNYFKLRNVFSICEINYTYYEIDRNLTKKLIEVKLCRQMSQKTD